MELRNSESNFVGKWAREPLVHFLILGAGIFLVFGVVSGPVERGDERIVVTAGQVENLVTVFSKTRQRPPSDVELGGLIDDFVLEEVLYRQALAMGLDQNDTIIRRRLKQKMEFLVDDFAACEASETDLQRFLDDNRDSFREDAQVGFEHVHFKETSSGRATEVLASLKEDPEMDVSRIGDRLPLPSRFALASESEIIGLFGERFNDDLLAQEIGRWAGPIRSPYGLHLVKVGQRVEGRIPELVEIRDVVERDWAYERRRIAQQKLFDQLRSQYSVIIESREESVE